MKSKVQNRKELDHLWVAGDVDAADGSEVADGLVLGEVELEELHGAALVGVGAGQGQKGDDLEIK